MRRSVVSPLLFFVLVVAILVDGRHAGAQCDPRWLDSFESLNLGGSVQAVCEWDPDGPGPLSSRIVVGGDVWRDQVNVRVGMLDVTEGTCEPFSDEEINGEIYAVTVLPDGQLVIGGAFGRIGTRDIAHIARWSGSSWEPLGTGTNGAVRSLAVDSSGKLIAGGTFTAAGGVPALRIATWSGSAWSALGGGVNNVVNAIVPGENGELVIGGGFTLAGGTPASRVARWNGSGWSTFGAGVNSTVLSVHRSSDGTLLFGGAFTMSGNVPVNRVARWDGTAWQPLGSGFANGHVAALTTLPSGELIAGGAFTTAGSTSVSRIARWSNGQWNPMGSGAEGDVLALHVLNDGDLLVGGAFTSAGSYSIRYIGGWNSSGWYPLGRGPNGIVQAMVSLPDGHVVAAGDFTHADRVLVNHVAEWDGLHWTPLSPALGITAMIYALATGPDNSIVAGGLFASSGLRNIARWDGSAWQPLGAGLNGEVLAVGVLPNGDIVAGGAFTHSGTEFVGRIARWNGEVWRPVGSGISGGVSALAIDEAGGIVVGGSFTLAGGVPASNIARWDGTTWNAMGAGLNTVTSVACRPGGDVFAAVYLSGSLYRWNGTTWTVVSGPAADRPDRIYAIAVRPNGNVLIGGYDIRSPVAEWDGVAWSSPGTIANSTVYALTCTPGEVHAGGVFEPDFSRATAYWRRSTDSGMPIVARSPSDADGMCGGSVEFSFSAVTGYEVEYVWLKNSQPVDLADSRVRVERTRDASTLSIDELILDDAGSYSCRISTACGTVDSGSAQLTVEHSSCCAADFNHDGRVDSGDFFDFLIAFFAIEPSSDFNADGSVNSQDFFDFLAALSAGC